ncbi:hypothetical protein [Vibrio metschnikovii]|uniref:hypothetical protein n=1 Tax=Vibrio metschnikovii TaxID=28172 RepID=UPI001C2FA53B|nr:hypothetical protein [Vibrio metschnikovii]
MLKIWMFLTGIFLLFLICWSIFFVDNIEHQIAMFGIVGVIITAITSVVTVTLNNSKAKQRELEMLINKERQKVFSHFYNAYFESLKNIKSGKRNTTNAKVQSEILEFKRGLMNWGSEDLIKKYVEFESKMHNPTNQESNLSMLKDGDKFLKALRKEMGFTDSDKVNILSIILDPESRNQLDNI